MPFDPDPCHLPGGRKIREAPPQSPILHLPALDRPPPPRPPPGQPLGDACHDGGAVGMKNNAAPGRNSFQSVDDPGQLHGGDRGGRVGSGNHPLHVIHDDERSPAAGAQGGPADAGSVRIDNAVVVHGWRNRLPFATASAM